MMTTYRCKACDATWSDDHAPAECPYCASRTVERGSGPLGSMEDHYSPPLAPLVDASPVSSTAFSILFWLGWLGFLGGFFLVGAAGANNQQLAMAAGLTLVVSGVCLLAAYILSFVKIYRAWDLIQPLRRLDPDSASMPTPGLAIGLLFVPFYNLYWNFVSLHGLAVKSNRYMALTGIEARPMKEGVAQAYCILILCSIVPSIGSFVALANLIVFYLFMLDVDRARGAIRQHREGVPKLEFGEGLKVV